MKKIILILILAGAVLFLIVIRINRQSQNNSAPAPMSADGSRSDKEPQIEIIATGLKIPWDVDFLPTGEILVTERPGNLLIIGQDKKIIKVDGVRHVGEGGLLGIAVHPEFDRYKWIYLYLTSQTGSKITNRVERYVFAGNSLSERKVIIEGIAGSSVHDGGQLAFGPDEMLYISTGDANIQNLAQDKNSLNGKILRLHDDGSVPDDNPFGNAVYSYGHRNPQGLAWDDNSSLWAAEHGPSGLETGNDELNLIEKGKNYGWPVIRGQEAKAGMEKPVIESGRNETWAPSGLAFFAGRLYFAGLKGETLYAFNPGNAELKKYFAGQYGRLRAVKTWLGGLYFTTSNTDGRGNPTGGDDKLILIRDSGILK